MSVIGIALGLFFSFSERAYSGELDLLPGEKLPILEDVRIDAVVDWDEMSGVYQYLYSISNPDSNTGAIWTIDVGILAPEDSKMNSNVGISDGPRFREGTSRYALSNNGKDLIPVGLFPSSNWSPGITHRGAADGGRSDVSFRIHPGGALGDFEMFSRGLPGVRTIYVKPKFEPKPVEEAAMADIERVAANKEAVIVSLKTIGPIMAPAEFVALDFLYYIRGLQQEAERLGWITSIGVGNSLDGKLNNVRKKLQFGNSKAAANILNTFINEVEAQGCATYDDCPKGKHLSSEAWALLKFNAEYLLGRL